MCHITTNPLPEAAPEAATATPNIGVEGLEHHGYCNTSDGVSLYYALFGKGSTKVVLLMGIATSGLAWKNQIEYLIKFPQFQVCIVDNRGCGKTVTPNGRITTQQMAQDVVTLLDHLGWDRMKVHLVGNSLGGMIAQEVAFLVPDQVATFTLIATHAGGLKAYIPPVSAMVSISRSIFARDQKDYIKILFETVMSREHLKKPGRKEHLSIIDGEYPTVLDFYVQSFVNSFTDLFARENTVFKFLQQFTAVLTHYVSPWRLSSLRNKFPTLIISGTDDKIVHTRHSRYLAQALGAELLEFPGAGHAVTEECLDDINNALFNHFCKSCN